MPTAPIPSRPIDAYKRIIDDLVERTDGISSRLVREAAIFSRSRSDDAVESNAFVRSLSPQQREILARMLSDEYTSGIGVALAELTWWIDCHGLALSYRGEPMPTQLSGMGLHGDYIGRLDNWPWPEEADQTTDPS